MTTLQYNIFIKQMTTFHAAKYGEYSFTIKPRIRETYELNQIYKGAIATLYVGTFSECLDAVKETVQMISGNIS